MKVKYLVNLYFCFQVGFLSSQGPEVTSWIINTNNAVGYGNIPSNVQQVQYSAANVYISASCVPAYSIGPWTGNPNTPVNMNFVYKITRNPQQNTGTPTAVGLGHIGVWTNGVSIFNVSDAQSYNNQGIWNRNAFFWEGPSFDNCLGHPAPNGEYHHHVSPACLYDVKDSLKHSPIIGYAFDGFPVYGAYGYANTNGTGAIKRMKPSYSTTTTANRTNGPVVNATYPVGCFLEDYSFTQGSGDLDARNGRNCITPEYPAGTYAYFVTINAALAPIFPYTFFGSYYGTVQSGNTGPNGGHNTIGESVVSYTPGSTVIIENNRYIPVKIFPNPSSERVSIFLDALPSNDFSLTIVDALGNLVLAEEKIQPTVTYSFDVSFLPTGIYSVRLHNAFYNGLQILVIK